MSKPIELNLNGQDLVAIPVHEYNVLNAKNQKYKEDKENIKVPIYKMWI